ncbi:hypothetical protein QUF61_08475 [Candidatus Venteria ishoeyi]|uniref:hypothetical protein n=1 Tax=Candidatus Venteria ishoeyi TaxID=1899563 RepID=UPI0025A636B6|nr:hypothetical protein [Candidatus Venteria ishoeyi]MDM8546517.1 hypothetical protein [Candidatus Venteria ishoeyi]
MMRMIQKMGLYCCLWLLFSLSQAAPLSPQAIPEPLKPWQDWVLHNQLDWSCSFLNQTGAQICRWPGNLQITVTENSAYFRQHWHLGGKTWVELPGDKRHWPQNVQIAGLSQHTRSAVNNTESTVVIDRNGQPSVYLPAGDYLIQGQWDWQKRPESLQIPPHTALVSLSLDGQVVKRPKQDKQGRLWLDPSDSDQEKQKADRLDLHVYRQLVDDMPLQETLLIKLNVSGQAREISLPPLFPAEERKNWQVLRLNSDFPVRLEADTRLRTQVKACADCRIELVFRHLGPVNSLQASLLTEEEVWVFAARHDLRRVDIQGLTAIDPQQTRLPKKWQQLPAYRVQKGDTLKFVETRRGNPEPAPNDLRLRRKLWLDFDGGGFTVSDMIAGTMSRDWRLDVNLPLQLGRVNVNGSDQLITQGVSEPDSTRQGVELRQGHLDLRADSRIEMPLRTLPAVAWAQDMQKVSTRLYLPPGWKLFHLSGADKAPRTWLKRWTLLDLFIVLITALAIAKLWHWSWGALALLTLLLIYHEPDAPRILWLLVLATMALLRVLPRDAWLAGWVKTGRNLLALALVIMSLSFMVSQVRISLYPQLANSYRVAPLPRQQAAVGSMGDMIEAEEAAIDVDAMHSPEPAPMLEQNMLPQQKALSGHRLSLPSSADMSRMKTKKSHQYYGKAQKSLTQIDPRAQVQTGPGLPDWQWNYMKIGWNGPVKQDQEIRLYLLTPTMNLVLGLLRTLLLALLLVFLLWQIGGGQWSDKLPKNQAWLNTLRHWLDKISKKGLATLLLLILAVPLLLQNNTLQAAETSVAEHNLSAFPNTDLLQDFQNRLLEPPDCLPDCAANPRLHLEASPDSLRIQLEIHTQTRIAIPLPGKEKQWLPQQVWVNDQSSHALQRDDNGILWLLLSPGIHQVRLEGNWPSRNLVQLPLSLPPRKVSVKLEGWRLEGLDENGFVESQLQFHRQQNQQDKKETLETGALPPFVQVERKLLLGLDWQVQTTVSRRSPGGSGILLAIPLLAGESVTSAGVRVEDGRVMAQLKPEQNRTSWVSVFEIKPEITLTAPDNHNWMETWKVDTSAIWHLDITGIPVVHHQDNSGLWLPTWRPWPGESVTLRLTRPQAMPGQVLTIENSHIKVQPGQRASDVQLLLSLRSSRGGEQTIGLPEDAELLAVKINGKEQPIRAQNNKISLPLKPGQQAIKLELRLPGGITNLLKTPVFDLGTSSVNTHLSLRLPEDRWVLFLGSSMTGPAVLFWGILIVLILLSLILGRIPLTPLNSWQWLLLAVVTSQLHISAMLLMAGWLLALGWRGQLNVENLNKWRFDFYQIGLFFLTLFALAVLFTAIEQGLLGRPEMYIQGNGSYYQQLNWYQDHSTAQSPQAWVYSLPIWVYRLVMLAWALWLAFALLRWLRWGWQCFSAGGLWKRLRKSKIEKNTPSESNDSR